MPNFRHSMTCERHREMEATRVDGVDAVADRRLPTSIGPTIIVNGDSNSMACSLSGEKARMPRMASFSIWDMVASSLRRRARLCVRLFSQLAEAGAAAAAPLRAAQLLGGFSQRCDSPLVERVSSGGGRW